MKNDKYSEPIISALLKETNEIEPSDGLFEKIKADIYKKECEQVMKSKSASFKKGRKLTALVASFVLLFSVTVLGATILKGNTWMSSSNHKYRTLPSQEKVLKDIGFSPKYAESLPGGFEYVGGGTGDSKLSDETGETLTETKSLELDYRREDEKSTLSLSITQVEEIFLDDEDNELVGDLNGINLYYYQKDYKFVPPNYELTEEDKKLHEDGLLEISSGSSEISNSNIQGLSWYEDGLHYTIMGGNYNFTVEEMIDMAVAIIKE